MKIEKIYQPIPITGGNVLDTKSNSSVDTYSCNYLNDKTVFIAKYKETTYDEIAAAHEAGKTVIGLRDEYQYQLYAIRSTECEFSSTHDLTAKTITVDNNNNWTNSTQSLQKDLFFNTEYDKNTNKVATMADTLDLYSSDEKRIGTWIDGKPLYRRALPQYTITSSTEFQDVIALTDIKQIISIKGFCIHSGGNTYTIPFAEFNPVSKETYTLSVIYSVTRKSIQVRHNGFPNAKLYAIIEYTKTTD